MFLNMHNQTLKNLLYGVTLVALTASPSTFASNDENSGTSDYQDSKYSYQKKDASDYWDEFKQDSNQTWKDTKSAFRDGWIEGKLETALILNKHLNPFDIDIKVDDNRATLSGTVNSDIKKELAETIAIGIEGIDSVNNNIDIKKDIRQDKAPSERVKFSQYMKDISITAGVKTDLLSSNNISGMDINVDTKNAKVILMGEVATETQKNLAEKIAEKNDDVVSVTNNLQVKSPL